MSQKVVELYLATLKEYGQRLNKSKLTLLMQVGEFFEIYGIIYPDGTREGNVWEFCDDVNLKVAAKPQVVYDRPEIQVFMGGVGESYVNPYLQKAVDRFGWTVVIFDQQRIGNTNKFERREASIISPGVNINSDSFSNIAMVIYMEQTRNYYNKQVRSIANNQQQIQIGVAYVNCLTGENGVMAINNAAASDISIPLDELLKLLTIKNPNELNIYLEGISQEQFNNDELINSLHLFNYNYKIHRITDTSNTIVIIDEKITKLEYQSNLLERVYIRHRGLMDIAQQLGIDGAEHTYSRIALILLLEFILKHDRTILDKLETPDIILNSDKYLMLANNALEQLDVLDNLKQDYKKFSNRVTLLDLLDNTKTPLGKTLFRQRLSIPITESHILEERYQQISELLECHKLYLSRTSRGGGDKYGSPLFQLRAKLAPIRNIENYLRKAITGKLQPFEISSYLESLEACKEVYNYLIHSDFKSNTISNTQTNTQTNTQSNIQSNMKINKLYPNSTIVKTFTEVIARFKSDVDISSLRANVWNGIEANPFKKGVSQSLDELQSEIDNDRGFLDNLIIALSQVIDSKWQVTHKPLIYTGENATKGIHIFTNTSRKEILDVFFAKKNSILKVGHYNILAKDIKFLKMKESKWEIEIPYLKTSNGTLKANIDRIGRLAKQEFNKWLTEHIISQVAVLDALGTFSSFIGEIDVLQSNVLNAVEKGYTRPVINTIAETSFLDAKLIRHPIIEHIMTTNKYVPNDIALGAPLDGTILGNGKDVSADGILLFGVNAVGKSSLMKSLGVNVIMAQAGMYVSASQFIFKPFKYLFTRILGNDNLYAGLSSFEVEMKEFKVILKYSNADSLLLCDEVCKGTVTEDGTALVASAVEILSRRKVKFLSATHLHNLTNMECVCKLDNIKFYHLLVEQDHKNPQKLIYTRKLQSGSGPSSYGILVARSMNMDDDFITRAQEIRNSINNGIGNNLSLEIGSRYHKDKVIGKCEICNMLDASDVHHINQQCDTDSSGLLDTIEAGIFNKNKLWNLVALCKECHQSVHSFPPRVTITGYIPTSIGLELDFKWLANNIGYKQDTILPILATIGNLTTDNEEEYIELEPAIQQNYKQNCNKQKQSNKYNLLLDLSDNLRQVIIDMKKTGATPKKIQFDIKRHHQLNISQQQIRELK